MNQWVFAGIGHIPGNFRAIESPVIFMADGIVGFKESLIRGKRHFL
jgi:hypothetical protein